MTDNKLELSSILLLLTNFRQTLLSISKRSTTNTCAQGQEAHGQPWVWLRGVTNN
jgi:hypothetical protein